MKKVLVVDDEESLRFLVMTLLEEADCTLAEARDGEEALRQVRSERPDLVLLDVMLPKVDGLTVCREIKADPQLAGTTVALLTAKTAPSDREAGLAAGADAYLAKPVPLLKLLTLVDQVLQPGLSATAAGPGI
ncbi:MAG: two-component system response regulator [Dehalococcoidia bacterium]|nr:two-component system response regulator [Dehalococcoidia bacterium]